jgi:hypothetical protein
MARNRQEERAQSSGRKHKYYSSGGGADYSKLDGQRCIELIESIAVAGGAIRLGKTRDGGAYAIGVYGDGDQPYTDYLKPNESVIDYLSELAEVFRDQVLPRPTENKAPKEGTK